MKVTELKFENPYVGPRPFEEREQRRFFGRDWEADELVSLVVAHPAVLLYAQSGAGKTSLINAKLIPLLRDEEGLQIMPVARVRGEVPEEVQPEQIKNLFVFNTLLGWRESEADPAQLAGLSLLAFLIGETEGWPRPKDEEGQPTLRVVIFDQFEELFALYPERWTEREGFFAQVADALSKDPFLRVLFALREDYLAQLDPYIALLPERLRTRFRLERLRQEAALAAVKGPLMDTERLFAPGVAESLVEELLRIRVETRVGETVEVPGEFVEPVQLQVVCRSLWEELPPDVTEITQPHLRAFGDVDQALLTFYERALRNAVQQAKVREGGLRAWFERDLITPMGTRGTVYRGAKSTGGVPNVAIDALEGQHLIRAERRAGARWYELTHDRFIRPIQRSNEAWRAVRRERWLRIGGGIAVFLVLLVVGITALQAIISEQEFARVQATATVAVQEAGTAVAQVEATATAAEATTTAALDSKNQATADFHVWQTAQAQATAASGNLQTVQAQATATATRLVAATPQPGGTGTPSWDPTATAVVQTATAAAQSLQIAEQKVVAAAAELKATATAAASATAAARELGERLETAGLTGRGVKVAIVATGIDPDHPDFARQIVAGVSFVGDKRSYRDDNGLGTCLASMVAGDGTASRGLYKGWAPEADLYIAKVLQADGSGAMSDVMDGIKWAVEQEVDIVLVPLASAPGCDGSDALSQEADAAVEAGLVVVVPAGNSGPEPGTVGSPGCAREPITVGAAELNTVANFSSRGPTPDGRTKPDLLFPHSGVGAQANGTEIGSVVAPSYVEITGSGISAAHAVGAIALLLQVDPNLAPAEVKALLIETATDLGFEANAQGAGLANIEEALARVRDRDGDGIPDYVYVPVGEFTMGSDEGGSNEDERPVHTVYLDAFYIDRTEVTNAQFAAFVSATGYETDAEHKGCGWIYKRDRWECVQGVNWQHPFGPDADLAGKDKHPVVQVSWNDAKAYCEWAGARLPTEAEWEKAARGTDGRAYPWGNTFDESKLNFCDKNCPYDWKNASVDDGYADIALVGNYPAGASLYGALDMAGNVWEWVADWYDSGYYGQSPERDPPGPDSDEQRGLRGGSWGSISGSVRSASRRALYPDSRNDNVGFRCAR